MRQGPKVETHTVPNVLTVDVEDWYTSSLDLFPDTDVPHGSKPHPSVVPNTQYVLDLLEEKGHKATFFVLGTVAQYYPEIVQEIAARGHEVASHGYGHQLLYDLTPEQFREDLRKSLNALREAGAQTVRGYRAPYWSITLRSLWALHVLAEEGFLYDSSIFPIRRSLYGIPHAPTGTYRVKCNDEQEIIEIPPTAYPICGQNLPIAGGGYLRLIPYSIVFRLVRKMNSKGLSAIMYLHPYELDPRDVKPRHRVRCIRSLASLLSQRSNRAVNPRKIQQLLQDFEFVSIASILKKTQVRNVVCIDDLKVKRRAAQ